MKKEQYKETVDLLLEILPYALQDERVALKGGTAINLFHRDFPRFSVDIDLCYLPLEDRKTTFSNLHKILKSIKEALQKKLGLHVSVSHPLDGEKEAKLVASKNSIGVKIELNFILRGSLFPPQDFLVSFVSNKPDWSKIREAKIKDYPSVKWKLYNQGKIGAKKRNEYIEVVKSFLNG